MNILIVLHHVVWFMWVHIWCEFQKPIGYKAKELRGPLRKKLETHATLFHFLFEGNPSPIYPAELKLYFRHAWKSACTRTHVHTPRKHFLPADELKSAKCVSQFIPLLHCTALQAIEIEKTTETSMCVCGHIRHPFPL